MKLAKKPITINFIEIAREKIDLILFIFVGELAVFCKNAASVPFSRCRHSKLDQSTYGYAKGIRQ